MEASGRPAPDRGSSVAGTVASLTVFRVPIRFHFTFVLILVFFIVTVLGGKQSVLTGLGFIAGLAFSVVAHELGHVWMARHYGIQMLEIVMFPIGGVARMKSSPEPSQELWIALAGPAVNLVIAAVGFALMRVTNSLLSLDTLSRPSQTNLLEWLTMGNLALAGFNLIPAFPMDGGRVLRALLSRFKSEDEATSIAAAAGRVLSIAMGLYGLLMTQYMLVFIAFFVYLGAAQESAAAKGRLLTHGVPVQAATVTEFRTLPHGSTIRDAANLLLATSQQDFPVVHGETVIGLLGRNQLLKALATEGPEAYVAGVMDRDPVTLPPDTDLSEALPLMARAGSCVLVMDGDRLIGMLTTDNLSEFLVLRSLGLEAKTAA